MQSFREPVDEVQEEVKKRQNELQTVLVLSQEFETISEELVTWLAAIEQEQAKEKTVSAMYETVKKQQQEHKVRVVITSNYPTVKVKFYNYNFLFYSQFWTI